MFFVSGQLASTPLRSLSSATPTETIEPRSFPQRAIRLASLNADGRAHLPPPPSAAERIPAFGLLLVDTRPLITRSPRTSTGTFTKTAVHSTITANEASLCGLCRCLEIFSLPCKVLSILDRLVKSVGARKYGRGALRPATAFRTTINDLCPRSSQQPEAGPATGRPRPGTVVALWPGTHRPRILPSQTRHTI
jgi:hypothetical protein